MEAAKGYIMLLENNKSALMCFEINGNGLQHFQKIKKLQEFKYCNSWFISVKFCSIVWNFVH